MQLKKNKTDAEIVQNILVISDCSSGAERAAWFAIRNVYNHNSIITLLQTYQTHSFGQSMIRNIVLILEKTAKQELSELKNQIVKNTNVNPESISKKVINGKLFSVLKQRIGKKTSTAVIIGIERELASPDRYFKKSILSAMRSGIRPIYIVGSGITRINNDRVTYFYGEKNLQKSPFYQYLNRLFSRLGLKQSIMVSTADSQLIVDKTSYDYLSSKSRGFNDEYPLSEKLFRSLKEGSDDVILQPINQL